MPKMKTKRAAAKRFRVLGSGKIKRAKASRRHKLEHKSRARKRRLSEKALVDSTQEKNIKLLVPYMNP